MLDLATKGAREYKLALAFNEHKWDSAQMESKHSGDTVQNYIEYVRREMYRSTVGVSEDNEEAKVDLETEDIVASEMEDTDDKFNSIQDEEIETESKINEDNIILMLHLLKRRKLTMMLVLTQLMPKIRWKLLNITYFLPFSCLLYGVLMPTSTIILI